MKVYTDKPFMLDIEYYKELNSKFLRKIGVISCADRLIEMGLEPRDVSGIFWARDTESLEAVCRIQSDLHIVTNVAPCHTVNRYVEGRYKYWLADGEADPRLELILPPEIVNHLFAELNHFVRRLNIGF